MMLVEWKAAICEGEYLRGPLKMRDLKVEWELNCS